MSGQPVLVIGAGPAGLAAADAISAHGGRVMLVDDNPAPGGQIWRGGPGQWRDRRADVLWNALQERPAVEWLFGARVVGSTGPNQVLLDLDGAARVIDWDRAIVCTGARELLLPFPGWTLPGVFGAGGLQALVKGGMPVRGKRVVVAGSGPLLLAAAGTARRHGADLVALAEHRSNADVARFAAQLALAHRPKLLQAAALAARIGIPRYLRGATVIAAKGDTQVRSVILRHRGAEHEIACDYLACGYGLVPALEVASMLGCDVTGGRVAVDGAQRAAAGVWAAGESTGIGGVDKALAEGRIAGLSAIGMPPSVRDFEALRKAQSFAALVGKAFAPGAELAALCTPDTIVCRCEDVTAAQLAQHDGWRGAKLQTRVGMGACQGRVCGTACQFLYGWEAPGLRQPVLPASAAVLANRGGTT